MSTDAELLDAARNGDPAAVEALLTRHAPMVLRFAHSMCDRPEDADEVAQDALITAARALREVRGERVSSWFYTVTRSFCSKKRRRRKGQPVSTDALDAEVLRAPHAGPEDALADRELGDVLQQAIQELEPKQRAVLLLRDVEGLTAPEVAEALGIEVATVKTRLHRARAAVREKVAPRLGVQPKPSPSCPEVVERFSRYLEGDIGPRECERMQAHVDSCAACSAACQSLRQTISLCRVSPEPSPEVVDRVRTALRVVLGKI